MGVDDSGSESSGSYCSEVSGKAGVHSSSVCECDDSVLLCVCIFNIFLSIEFLCVVGGCYSEGC